MTGDRQESVRRYSNHFREDLVRAPIRAWAILIPLDVMIHKALVTSNLSLLCELYVGSLLSVVFPKPSILSREDL